MVQNNVLPLQTNSASPLGSQKLKTAPIKAVLLITQDATPKPLRKILATLLVLLADYRDVKSLLPVCRMKLDQGALIFKISIPGYVLGVDAENDLTVVEYEEI